MAQKREQSSYTVASAIKSAMQVKNIYPVYQPDHAVYDGGQNDSHLLHGQMDDGWFRTINVSVSGTTFDFINPTDGALVRIWTEREISVSIGSFPGVSYSDGTKTGNTWSHTIRYNGTDYTATDAVRVNAICKAFTNLLNSI